MKAANKQLPFKQQHQTKRHPVDEKDLPEEKISYPGPTHCYKEPVAYVSPFFIIPHVTTTTTTTTTTNEKALPTKVAPPFRPKPILVSPRKGPVPILPRGHVPSISSMLLLVEGCSSWFIPHVGIRKSPIPIDCDNSQQQQQQQQQQQRGMTKRLYSKVSYDTHHLLQDHSMNFNKTKKTKTKSRLSAAAAATGISTLSEMYSKIVSITEHPSSILIPNGDTHFVLPDIPDDSITQTYPIEKVQVIDILMDPRNNEHLGNQLFHTLISSYQQIYQFLCKTRKQELTHNLIAFLRLQGVRCLTQQSDGRYYECGTQRWEHQIKNLLSTFKRIERREKKK